MRPVKRCHRARPLPQKRSEALRKLLAASLPYGALPPQPLPATRITSPRNAASERTLRNTLTSTPEPMDGFEKLFDAFSVILSKMGGIGLEEGWSRVGEWLEHYESDDVLSSTGDVCTAILDASNGNIACFEGNAAKQRAACAFLILEQALLYTFKMSPILKPALRFAFNEVLHSTLDNYELVSAAAIEDPSEIEAALQKFCGASLFKESVGRATALTQEVKATATTKVRNLKVFCEKVVKMTNQSYLRVVFKEWRLGVQRAKRFQGWFDDERGADHPHTFVTENTQHVEQQLNDALEQITLYEHEREVHNHDMRVLEGKNAKYLDTIKSLEKLKLSQTTQIEQLTETTKELTKMIATLKGLSNSTEQVAKEFEDAHNTLSSAVATSIEVMSGGEDELREKQARWGGMDILTKFTPNSLMEWVNCVITPVVGTEVRAITTWEAGPHLLVPLCAVVHSISPNVLDADRLAKVATTHSFRKKAETLLKGLEAVSIHYDVGPEELCKPTHTSDRSAVLFMTIASLLYVRYTSGVAARAMNYAKVLIYDGDAERSAVGFLNAFGAAPVKHKNSVAAEDSMVTESSNDPGCVATIAKTRLQQCEQSAAEGAAWLRSSYEGLLTCIQTLTRNLVHSSGGNQNSGQDFSLTLDDVPFVDAEEDLATLNSVLAANREELSNIFAYYASHVPGCGGALKVMDESEYMKFVLDAKLLGKQVTRNDLADLLARISPAKELNLREWIVLLPRLARLKFKSSGDGPVAKLNRLLGSHVLTNSKQLETDVFRKGIYSEKVQAVLKEHAASLSWLYRNYEDEKKVMNKAGYDKMLHDLHIVDQSCTNYIADEVYKRIQDPDDASEDLVHHEFLEAIVTLAAVKRPEPYLPLSQRVKYFVENSVLPLRKLKEKPRKHRKSMVVNSPT